MSVGRRDGILYAHYSTAYFCVGIFYIKDGDSPFKESPRAFQNEFRRRKRDLSRFFLGRSPRLKRPAGLRPKKLSLTLYRFGDSSALEGKFGGKRYHLLLGISSLTE